MFIPFVKKMIVFACLTIPCESAMPSSVHSDEFFILHQVIDVNPTTCLLNDGSIWQFQSDVSPYLEKGGFVWIVPIVQETSSAVLFSCYYAPTTVSMIGGSTVLSIKTVTGTGEITLSDESEWTLNPHYQKYTSSWKIDDPITIAGRHNEYYLINGRTEGAGPTYSLATKQEDELQAPTKTKIDF